MWRGTLWVLRWNLWQVWATSTWQVCRVCRGCVGWITRFFQFAKSIHYFISVHLCDRRAGNVNKRQEKEARFPGRVWQRLACCKLWTLQRPITCWHGWCHSFNFFSSEFSLLHLCKVSIYLRMSSAKASRKRFLFHLQRSSALFIFAFQNISVSLPVSKQLI